MESLSRAFPSGGRRRLLRGPRRILSSLKAAPRRAAVEGSARVRQAKPAPTSLLSEGSVRDGHDDAGRAFVARAVAGDGLQHLAAAGGACRPPRRLVGPNRVLGAKRTVIQEEHDACDLDVVRG